MTRKEQVSNGFTEMMKGFWGNQDLEVPDFEEPCKQEPCENVISRLIVQEEISKSIALKENSHQMYKRIQAIPSVTPKFTDAEIQSNDCISRQAVLDCLTATELKKFDFIIQAREAINNLPPVTPQQKVGKWMIHPNGVYAHLVCSKCLTNAPYDCKTNYCPNCGAKMEVE